jgi:transposase
MSGVRARYSKEFKEEAVSLILVEGFPLAKTAHAKGIPISVLSKWVKSTREGVTKKVDDRDELSTADELKSRLMRLENRVEILRKLVESAFQARTDFEFPTDKDESKKNRRT